MSVYNLMILSGAAAAALIAWGERRYLVWLMVLALSYGLSVIYWRMNLPQPEFFAGICDAVFVWLIVWRAKYTWELWLGALFLTSLFINLVYLANNLLNAQFLDHVLYSGLLEVINLAAIFLIGGVASFDKAGSVNGRAFRPWLHIFGTLRPVYRRYEPRD